MIKVFVAIPTIGTMSDAHMHTLREIEERYKDEVQLVYPASVVRRIFHDFARNALVDEFMETDCDIMWFLDSDVVPPKHVMDLVTLHASKWQAAGAPYPVFMTPPGEEYQQVVFTVYKENKGAMVPTAVPHSGTDFVDGIATGCLFLKRELIAQMQKPYFEFKYHPDTRMIVEGEDIGFCKKLHQMGVQFFIDYGMPCKHYKTVDLLDVNNYAMTYAQKSLTAYQRALREQIAESVKAKVTANSTAKSKLILPAGIR